jgi:hypothetical protein
MAIDVAVQFERASSDHRIFVGKFSFSSNFAKNLSQNSTLL